MQTLDLDKNLIDTRRKRIKFRAWHRGTKEMDLLLGSFVDITLASLTELELAELEQIIECNDIDLYSWISGRESIPAAVDTTLMEKLKAHSLSKNQ